MAEQVPVPARITELRLLERVDYQDAFAAWSPEERSPEQWARLIADGAPGWLRLLVRGAHRLLGLRLAPSGSPQYPMGWHVLAGTPDSAVLGVDGGLVTPRLVVGVLDGQVIAATLVRYDHPAARPLWAVLAPVHRGVARYLVRRGARGCGPPAARSRSRPHDTAS